jgi:hypothetical protein
VRLEEGSTPAGSAAVRAPWRAVAVPAEHGGWGLTLEPVLLGLLVAWSWPGLLIGLAAFGAFLARTPLKLAVVDARRRHWRDRSRLAARIAGGELTVVALMVALATVGAGWRWWAPVAIGAPLLAVEAWYDVRSRSRRLVPELCGAIGVAGSAAAIAVAGGAEWRLAVAVWLVLAARSLGSIPFVRAQIARARRGVTDVRGSDLAQLGAVTVAGVAAVVDVGTIGGGCLIVVVGALQARWSRRTPPPVKVIGIRQMVLGVAIVAVTAIGVRAV